VRIFVISLCLLIVGCSGTPYLRSNPPDANSLLVRQTIGKVFAEIKLRGTPEVSQIRPAHPVSRGDWVLCLRSSDPTQQLRYAIYFTGFTFVYAQMAVLVDRCDEETYLPFIGDLT